MKNIGNLWVPVFVVVILMYSAEEDFFPTLLAISYVISIACMGIGLLNRFERSNMWQRNEKGRKAENSLTFGGLVLLAVTCFFDTTPEEDLKLLGGSILTIVILGALTMLIVQRPNKGNGK